jgi:RNA polymerase primary sigma factor
MRACRVNRRRSRVSRLRSRSIPKVRHAPRTQSRPLRAKIRVLRPVVKKPPPPIGVDTEIQAFEPIPKHEMDGERPRYDGNSALNLYLTEIGKTPLLTIEEEVELAKKIKRGDKKAREQMIKANLRLVVKIARDYEYYGMPLLDLVNEGNIGLMKAVERFDPAKGAKFSTYGAWWIKQSIKRALANQSKTIRLPVHVVDKVAHIRRASMKLQELFGREPDDEEIAAELAISPKRVRQYRAAAVAPMSLDASLGDDDSNRIADIVEDERAETPYQELEEKTNTSMVRNMLAKLDPREAAILRLRFNLTGDRAETLEEIGAKLGVTRERIRQIQENALKKLRRMIERLELSGIEEKV